MLVNHTYKISIKGLLLALCLAFATISLKAQTQVTAPMNSTPSAGEYFSYTGIALSPGFRFTAATGQSLRLYIVDSDCQPLATLPTATQNYIMTSIPRQPGINPLATGLSTCDLMQTIAYFDDLGRPLQTVQVKGSPFGKDIVQPVVYDQFGREAVKYLPYTATGTDGSYKTTAIADQSTFYHPSGTAYTVSQLPGGIAHIPTPYAMTSFEPSPLNRPVEQGAPGDAWQLTGTTNASGVAAGHTIKMGYLTNNTIALNNPGSSYYAAMYTISAISPTDQKRTLALGDGTNNFYGAGQLYVTVSKDENWTGTNGKAGTIEEYKDKEGHVVLKRTFNTQSGTLQILSTYYVYDDLGNLAYVLPPLSSADNTQPTQATLDNLCYQYRYDERNRLTQKKLPGKGWEYMVYNKLDQLVMSQDANQRVDNKWTIIKYDAFGRVIMTGIYNAPTVASLGSYQFSVYATLQWDTRDNTSNTTANPTGYVISTYPAFNAILTVNYYDAYTNIPGLPAGYQPEAGTYNNKTTGLPTATKTAILNTITNASPDYLWSASYYDDKGRNIKTYKQHYLGGTVSPYNYDDINSTYNFTDQVTATTRKHYTKNAGNTLAVLSLTITNTYSYDHMGRKVNTFEQIITPTNTGSNILLARNDYNEIGQLMTKHLHGATGAAPYLQDIDYAYNERGWLSMINNPANTPTTAKLFSEQLNYNVPQYTATPQFNGNIAEQAYKIYNSPTAGIQTVKYAYDQLNRLTDGTSSTGFSETGITYDVMGNIQALTRAAPNAVSLSYTYNGNQLTTVKNGTADFRSYTYDLNGNATSDGQGNTITYNMFNLPQTIASKSLTYTYDATGSKLRKVSGATTTEYISGIQYTGANIDFIQTEEGRAINSAGTYKYEYTLTDHLGNNRVTFDQTNGKVGEEDYYPFGLNVDRVVNAGNKYLYNKKELQDELSQYDYGARFYDPVIARWASVDPHTENYQHWSPYNYVVNNPITNVDPDGRDVTTRYVNPLGQTIINTNDGRDDIYVVPWNSIADFAHNINLWESPNGQNNPGVLDSQQWNNYWRGQFTQLISDEGMKRGAFGFEGLSDELKQEWIYARITGKSKDQWQFNRDYAVSLWKDPVVVVGSLLAFTDAVIRPMATTPPKPAAVDLYATMSYDELVQLTRNPAGRELNEFFGTGKGNPPESALRAYREIAKRTINGTAPKKASYSSTIQSMIRLQQINKNLGN